jgi:hypothetical protein
VHEVVRKFEPRIHACAGLRQRVVSYHLISRPVCYDELASAKAQTRAATRRCSRVTRPGRCRLSICGCAVLSTADPAHVLRTLRWRGLRRVWKRWGEIFVGLDAFAELRMRRTGIAAGWDSARAGIVRGSLGECVNEDGWLQWVGDFQVAVLTV